VPPNERLIQQKELGHFDRGLRPYWYAFEKKIRANKIQSFQKVKLWFLKLMSAKKIFVSNNHVMQKNLSVQQ
jgi:hypothetical protein